ncbi:hypothetical protein [Pseudoalteromonas luteoviolacea]|uniref:Uncharacterized protein n=1 Tax=Pseudoalteromonas luteoviolacea H33 TaxID=1365251 RepID=A0A167DXY3_9GAMM|nr:hypothetical protein [Pseudoalteromonas luteoviolacea]KZN49736.1 hypothetical protein N476_18260 [Pseudoalteromonas luteoviolacea H33]KZN77760.1 hypothetical protein N477_00715 [Pseudoalteromonas luteoviolacea H33-S]
MQNDTNIPKALLKYISGGRGAGWLPDERPDKPKEGDKEEKSD